MEGGVCFTCRIVHNYCEEHRPRSQTVSTLLNDRIQVDEGKVGHFLTTIQKFFNLFFKPSHGNEIAILTNVVVSSGISP